MMKRPFSLMPIMIDTSLWFTKLISPRTGCSTWPWKNAALRTKANESGHLVQPYFKGNTLPVERQRPTELEVLAHQLPRGRRRRYPLELFEQSHFGRRLAADRQPRPAGVLGNVGGKEAGLVLAKEAHRVRMAVVRTELDARLHAAQHYRVRRLHDVSAGEHVVPSLLVEQFDYPRVSVRTRTILNNVYDAARAARAWLTWFSLRPFSKSTRYVSVRSSARRSASATHWRDCASRAVATRTAAPSTVDCAASAAPPATDWTSTAQTRSAPAAYWRCRAPRSRAQRPASLVPDTAPFRRSPCGRQCATLGRRTSVWPAWKPDCRTWCSTTQHIFI